MRVLDERVSLHREIRRKSLFGNQRIELVSGGGDGCRCNDGD